MSDPCSTEDRRITLEYLRAFVAIVDGGGFERAAAQLGRTQSAVSQGLRKLEAILEQPLLMRRQGHVSGLTEVGECLLPRARDILARVSGVVQTVRQLPLTGLIRLGVPDDFAVADIHAALSRCQSGNVGLRLEVTSALSSALTAMVAARRLDVAIFKEASARADSHGGYVLKSEPLCWVGRDSVTFSDPELDPLPLVAFPEGCSYRRCALAALQHAGRSTWIAYASSSYENIRAAVGVGLGVAILPRSAVGRDHVILGEEQGFPMLPPVRLMLYRRDDDSLYLRFAAQLERAICIAGA